MCVCVCVQGQENVQQRSMTLQQRSMTLQQRSMIRVCVCVRARARAQAQENVQQKTLLAHPTHPVDTHMQNVTTVVSLSETRHQKQVPHLKRQRLTLGHRANIDVKTHGFPREMVYIHGDSSTSTVYNHIYVNVYRRVSKPRSTLNDGNLKNSGCGDQQPKTTDFATPKKGGATVQRTRTLL